MARLIELTSTQQRVVRSTQRRSRATQWVQPIGLTLAMGALLAGCSSPNTVSEKREAAATASSAPGQPTAPKATTVTPTVASSASPSVRVWGDGMFKTPSGNIACMGNDRFIGCNIVQRTWEPPLELAKAQEGCPSPNNIGMNSGRVEFFCGDYGAEEPVELPYNTLVKVGKIDCKVLEVGLDCRDTVNRKGFLISKAKFQLHG